MRFCPDITRGRHITIVIYIIVGFFFSLTVLAILIPQYKDFSLQVYIIRFPFKLSSGKLNKTPNFQYLELQSHKIIGCCHLHIKLKWKIKKKYNFIFWHNFLAKKNKKAWPENSCLFHKVSFSHHQIYFGKKKPIRMWRPEWWTNRHILYWIL